MTVVKRAEDGDGFVVRAYETAGRAARATLTVLGREIEADFGAARDQDVRAAARRRAVPRRTCSSGGARRRRLAAAGLARRRVAVAREQAVGRAGLAARARSGQRASTTSSAPVRCPTRTSSATAALAEWVAERTWIYRHARAAAATHRASRASTTRRRSSSTASEVAHHVGVVHAVRRRRCRDGRAPARGRRARGPGERAAGRDDESRARAQAAHGLRLGLLPAARAPGHLAPGRARRAARSCSARVELDGRRRHASRSDGDVVLRVERPELWWPNGLGEQRLYRARAGVATSASAPSSSSERGRPAMRCRTRSSSTASAIAMRGWNWVPLDALYGVPRPEKLAHLLELARARERQRPARVGRGPDRERRVLRPLRPARPPRLAGVLAVELRDRERARRTIRLRRDARRRRARDRPAPRARHPSLFALVRRQRARPGRRADSTSAPALAALRDVVRELDPARVWLPSSPTGPQGRTTCTGRGSTRACARTTRTTTARTNLSAQRVRRRGDDEPPRARGADRRRRTAGRPTARTRSTSTSAPGGTTRRSSKRRSAAGSKTSRRCAARVSGCSTRACATRSRRRCAARWRASGVLPWQFNESFPNAWCTVGRRLARRPEAGVLRRRARLSRRTERAVRDLRLGRRSARCAHESRARRRGSLDLDGRVVAEDEQRDRRRRSTRSPTTCSCSTSARTAT